MFKDVVHFIASQLVDYPDKIRVKENTHGPYTIVELQVAKEDIGRVVGREGRTAQAIRVVLQAMATKMGRKAQLDILD
ncbi:KH domain-containing protein [Pajaroellobacter abortibovis]|uniref:RNA-binding protein KhpA n=1 Tax=Pajaroellobacter abortibovis TaxID=1882918 RepID=A0A1L6MWN9_9BACT|nr:KH domain-containing protein [Pajaroellobacter abortibovis]APR99970.1 RNA-binding protein [Pajaroellobacter abortibovis]